MHLRIGNTTLADSTSDGITRWLRCEKPSLSLANDSVGIVGGRFSRNFSRAHGISFEVSVSVGRQFKSYARAETFSIQHLAELTNGASGLLDIRNVLGVRFGFENAVLESVKIANEIGVSTEFEYVFRCGKKADFKYAIVVNGFVLSINGKIPIVKE